MGLMGVGVGSVSALSYMCTWMASLVNKLYSICATSLENLDVEVDINSAWETIKENIKISAKEGLGYYELKKHKPWFDE
jgi:hypothetical protein